MSLTDKLQERYSASNEQPIGEEKQKRGAGKRLFLAQREEITKAINEGWSYKDIYEILNSEGHMPIVYRVFCRYIYDYITSKEKNNSEGSGLQINKDSFKPEKPKPVLEHSTHEKQKMPRGLGDKPTYGHFKDDDINVDELLVPQKPGN